MVLSPVPDLVDAVTAQILSFSEVQAVVANRVSGALQKAWDPMPKNAVVVTAASGPVLSGDDELGLFRSRLDFKCYGSTGREAMRTWRYIHSAICPDQSRRTSFVRDNCQVNSVMRERAPSLDTEEDTGWPRVTCSYIFIWSRASTP